MAKFQEKQKSYENQITPAPAPSAASQAPAMVVAQGIPGAAEILKDPHSAPQRGEGDDEEMLSHPTKDYDLANNAARLGGKRQFQNDIFCRQLNCTFFSIEVHKMWGANPLGGGPVPVTFTREFPEKNILYDHFEQVPSEHLLNYKRDLAHKHGYKYLYQYPSAPLTVQELDKQLKIEEATIAKQKK